MRIILTILLMLVLAIGASAQRHYICYYTAERPVIDGSGEEKAWQKAPWTEDFVDIEGESRPIPTWPTRTKLLWDKENLYIYAELREPDLWGDLRQHDTVIFRDNDFEVFIDPDNDTHNYFELEINALGTVMDLFLPKPYKSGGRALMGWDTHGLRSAVHLSGTLNQPGDQDKGWSVEMAIPLTSLRFFSDKKVPDDSTMWRINFSRVEWDKDVVGGQYVHREDVKTGRRSPEHNWVWSPQGLIDMHVPEKWGYLLFSTKPAGGEPVPFVLPVEEMARQYLWDVFYRQRKYRTEHGRYAADLSVLGVSGTVQDERVGKVQLEMEAITEQFMVRLTASGFTGVLSIDHEGKVTVKR